MLLSLGVLFSVSLNVEINKLRRTYIFKNVFTLSPRLTTPEQLFYTTLQTLCSCNRKWSAESTQKYNLKTRSGIFIGDK